MSNAISKASLLEHIRKKRYAQSMIDTAINAEMKRLAEEIESGTFDLNLPDIGELETENRMQAERNKRLEKELVIALRALEDIFDHAGRFGLLTVWEKSRQAIQQIKGDNNVEAITRTDL